VAGAESSTPGVEVVKAIKAIKAISGDH